MVTGCTMYVKRKCRGSAATRGGLNPDGSLTVARISTLV